MSDLIYKLDKTAEDIEELLREHKRLVYYMLTRTGQLQNPDAESAAWEALWDAINLFDVYADTAFSTFACTLIRNAINGVLRKQIPIAKRLCRYTDLAESLDTVYEVEQNEYIAFVEKCFKEYIESKSGIIRNILLVWYGSSFTMSVTMIAEVCNTSPSYVSRVQKSLRAYLSGRLKGY